MKWKSFPKIKKEQAAVVFIIGLLMMVITLPSGSTGNADGSGDSGDFEIGNTSETENQTDSSEAADAFFSAEEYAAYLEERLAECLEQMEGVGEAEVLITLKSSSEKVLAKDFSSSKSVTEEGENTQTDSETDESTVYDELEEGSTPYVIKELSPVIKGVLVVAQGGDDPIVKQNITDAVEALFSIESHKIMVVKMKE